MSENSNSNTDTHTNVSEKVINKCDMIEMGGSKEIQGNQVKIKKMVKKKERQTCNHCGRYKKKQKRLILYKCRCDNKYCGACLFPETHNCNFDYKEKGKEILTRNNPKVDCQKVIPI